MANFKQALIEAEKKRKKDEQEAAATKKIEANAQHASSKFHNKYNQMLGEFTEKSKQFKRLAGYETPMVLYLDMCQMWIDWIDMWKMAAPGLFVDFIKLFSVKLPPSFWTMIGLPPELSQMPIGGETVVGLADSVIKKAKVKMEMLCQNGIFNDPKVVMPLIIHAVELDTNNKLNDDSLKSFSTGTNITPELQVNFNESVALWLGQNGYTKCKTTSAVGCVSDCFYSDLSDTKTVLTPDAFKALRDDPVNGLNAYFQKSYDIELAKSPSLRP